jgi:hypothetical protein
MHSLGLFPAVVTSPEKFVIKLQGSGLVTIAGDKLSQTPKPPVYRLATALIPYSVSCYQNCCNFRVLANVIYSFDSTYYTHKNYEPTVNRIEQPFVAQSNPT